MVRQLSPCEVTGGVRDPAIEFVVRLTAQPHLPAGLEPAPEMARVAVVIEAPVAAPASKRNQHRFQVVIGEGGR